MKNSIKAHVAEFTKANDDGTYTFVLSDESIDRDGDIIKQEGWDFSSFVKNPQALWMHNKSMPPIGKWKNVRVVKGQTLGDLELAPDDVSAFQKGINKLVELGFIKATSVGFGSSDYSINKENGGYIFNKATLNEASLVTIGSNKNALALAKSFGVELGDVESDISDESEPLKQIIDKDAPPSLEKKTPNLDKAKQILSNLEK